MNAADERCHSPVRCSSRAESMALASEVAVQPLTCEVAVVGERSKPLGREITVMRKQSLCQM